MAPTTEELVHLIAEGFVCATEGRGHATPGGRPPSRIVVDATEGFIPLWQPGSMLKWRFQERSFALAPDPQESRSIVGGLMSEALVRWSSAAPVRFTHDPDLWDFEVVLRNAADCTPEGCVLASAFFPDGGRHELTVYPTMFEQSHEEQIETMIHEFGHVFGLRHFFAANLEKPWPSEVFGTHSPFSIMNYGPMSKLTDEDLGDLRELYRLAWAGHLTDINGTPVRFVRPYSASGSPVAEGAGALPVSARTDARAPRY